MLKNETNIILQRVKTYYPKFYYDEYIISSWYMELKYYDAKKIIEALRIYSQEHIEPPGVASLMAIAKRIETESEIEYETFCNFCGRYLDCKEQEEHENRCRSIRYIERKYKEIYNKNIDKKSLWDLSEEEFNEKYDKFLESILKSNYCNENEKFYLGQYFKENEERG